MIPLFYLLKDVGFIGTYWAMIVPSVALGLPFGIFFMRAFFLGLPYDLADAAKIDGCNEAVAEWTVGAAIAGLRRFEHFDRQMRSGTLWPESDRGLARPPGSFLTA